MRTQGSGPDGLADTAAAPGSAPILEAEADVWVVRANAYTQAALAELMRTRGIDLANQSAQRNCNHKQYEQQRPHYRGANKQVMRNTIPIPIRISPSRCLRSFKDATESL